VDEQEQRKRGTTRFSREARDRRIFERVREGFPYDEIGRAEGLRGVQSTGRSAGGILWGSSAPESPSSY
jgi:hypothetical protein